MERDVIDPMAFLDAWGNVPTVKKKEEDHSDKHVKDPHICKTQMYTNKESERGMSKVTSNYYKPESNPDDEHYGHPHSDDKYLEGEEHGGAHGGEDKKVVSEPKEAPKVEPEKKEAPKVELPLAPS